MDAIRTSVTPALCIRPEKTGVIGVSLGSENRGSEEDSVDADGSV